jgi:hypothetical protein
VKNVIILSFANSAERPFTIYNIVAFIIKIFLVLTIDNKLTTKLIMYKSYGAYPKYFLFAPRQRCIEINIQHRVHRKVSRGTMMYVSTVVLSNGEALHNAL